ncbi:Zn2 Cys6 DNA-binding protein [Fusarium sp. NRRL 52700]|nr:Zn2 Cys6 DNA-binding protein [Fusarium sp. NRRL 52700]
MSDTQTSSSTRRKPHFKSRTGCRTCRSRKVKCDEERPSCRKCLKRCLQCDYLDSDVRTKPQADSPKSLLDVELMHHFTISTAVTLAPDTIVRDLWRTDIPRMGFATDYVLDGITALAALHMARYDSNRRKALLAHASLCHTNSLSKALPLITHITSQNCSQLFIFGILTLFFNLAKPIEKEDFFLVGRGVVPEWLYLLRGIDTVVQGHEAIMLSSVSLIYKTSSAAFDFWHDHSPETFDSLSQLQCHIDGIPDAGNEAKKKALNQATLALSRSYTFLYGDQFQAHDKFRGFYMWLFEISDEFLTLLSNADQEALCVLAFYTTIIRELEKLLEAPPAIPFSAACMATMKSDSLFSRRRRSPDSLTRNILSRQNPIVKTRDRMLHLVQLPHCAMNCTTDETTRIHRHALCTVEQPRNNPAPMAKVVVL